ncbi:MAG TPA: hypothetical protein VEK11_01535 [Thermoanaerobaculia bacterium]|nr:hypothetical protein [Thermoanaerobaculia bacterium]
MSESPPTPPQNARSLWAEQFTAQFAAIPLLNEFVFPNPQYRNRKCDQEVCDLVLVLKQRGIICQLKARDQDKVGERLRRSIVKKAREGGNQVAGAIRTLSRKPVWCDHPRRGQVTWEPGELAAIHGVVLVECAGERVELPHDLSWSADGVPITYMDVSDFLNVVDHLRAFPDIERYLRTRAALGNEVTRAIGGEKPIFEHFVIKNGTFDEWDGYGEATSRSVRFRSERETAFIQKMREDRQHAAFIEYVSDLLATRSETYATGLNAETIARFDNSERRVRYLAMQEALADLSLPARRNLGQQLQSVQSKVRSEDDNDPRMAFAAAFFDEKPSFIYVVMASRGLSKQADYDRGMGLLASALAHYDSHEGMLLMDRGTGGFEVFMIRDLELNDELRTSGEKLFGKLRIDHLPGTLLP